MFSNARGLATALGLGLLTTSLTAQSMSVSPGGTLTGGSKAEVKYENRNRANQIIVVTVSGGFPIVTTIEIPIQLDSSGKGSGTWVVVGSWMSAGFNGPDVPQVTVGIK